MADKIAVLRDGRLEQFGTPLELFNNPDNRFVAGFIGSPAMNFLKGEIAEGGVALAAGGHIPLGPRSGVGQGDAIELGIRPRNISIAKTGGVKGEVTEVEQLGSESYIFVTLPSGEPLVIHQAGQTDIAIGQTVAVKLAPEAVHIFRADTGRVCR